MSMREAPKVRWLDAAEGTPRKPGMAGGILLEADFCAEHERGIERIWNFFQITEDLKLVGPERYKAKAVPPKGGVVFAKNQRWAQIIIGMFGAVPRCIRGLKKGEMRGEWCEDRCRITVTGSANIRRLERIYKGLLSKNAAIWMGGAGNNPFARPSFVVYLYDQIPSASAEQMRKLHEDTNALLAAAEATGIEKRLQATHGNIGFQPTGCRWYALAPRWARTFSDPKRPTKYPVIFWLNPYDQKHYNSGWFTVEELTLWPQGKGPVCKEAKTS
jgi:hypothetical protein